ncbi:MAG: DoxX family membrane protein [Proteobacteria bacterium]|nr:DoxX family membrane protein [Pseudomonadota bacterium]
MASITPARLLMALAALGLGVVTLVWSDFALQWQLVPKTLGFKTELAWASGAFLLLVGAGLPARRTARVAAVSLGVYWLGWSLLKLPVALTHIDNVGAWLGFCESFTIAIGGWALFSARGQGSTSGGASLTVARLLLGACLVEFGLSHFVYLKITAGLMPGWMPLKTPLAMLAGAGHIAAGLGLIANLAPRLAATAEAMMMLAITLLVPAAGLVADPASRAQWTALFVSLPLAGAVWAMAEWIGGPLLAVRSRP